MEIRKCRREDVTSVYQLISELKNTQFNFDDFQKVYYTKLSDIKNYYAVAVKENNIIGFVSLVIDYQLHHVDKVGTIEELIVDSKSRSQGVGKMLLNHAVCYAREKKCDVVELTSGFSRENAHRFYEKNGFHKGSFKFKITLK